MLNIGPGELIVILIVALVVFGPEKLPEMARTVGKGMRELRRATEDLKDQVENEIYDLDADKPRSPILKAPPGLRVPKAPPAAAPLVQPVPALSGERLASSEPVPEQPSGEPPESKS